MQYENDKGFQVHTNISEFCWSHMKQQTNKNNLLQLLPLTKTRGDQLHNHMQG